MKTAIALLPDELAAAAGLPTTAAPEVADVTDLLATLPPREQLAAARLAALLYLYADADASLESMLAEIDAISQYGVPVATQLAELEALLERWRPKH